MILFWSIGVTAVDTLPGVTSDYVETTSCWYIQTAIKTRHFYFGLQARNFVSGRQNNRDDTPILQTPQAVNLWHMLLVTNSISTKQSAARIKNMKHFTYVIMSWTWHFISKPSPLGWLHITAHSSTTISTRCNWKHVIHFQFQRQISNTRQVKSIMTRLLQKLISINQSINTLPPQAIICFWWCVGLLATKGLQLSEQICKGWLVGV